MKIRAEIQKSLYNQYFNRDKHWSYQLERCGILVGKKISDEYFLITEIIEDVNPISQSPFGVFRSTEHIYPKLIESIEQNPDSDYLGEWHTHPNGPNSASFIDILSMRSMINNPIYGDIEWAILLIIIKYQREILYYFDKKGFEIIKLEKKTTII
ncbi:Mov34/MPN/PAD-1 family protein [Candidatus Lokiarchaeum ossiferum]|uniref:Mov34/MPN/PAD-1 family protein n=1 Tax=Candidatus Lokiarchaeum ossiferum TaxID=2951803 RepID=UPI00352CBC6B